MNYFQLRGALGELKTLESLLSFGMSVNSLAGSDFGWDLHAQLPDTHDFAETAPEPGFNLQDELSWPMSARSAHFQIKSLNVGAKLSIPVSKIRSWIAGSKIGTPTFLVVNNYDQTTADPVSSHLITPFGLSKSLSRGQSGAYSHTVAYSNPKFSSNFVTVGKPRKDLWARIDLWTTAPTFMFYAEDRIPLPGSYVRGHGRASGTSPHPHATGSITDFDFKVVDLLADLAHSFITCFEASALTDERRLREIVQQLADVYAKDNAAWFSDSSANEWITERIGGIKSSHGSDLPIPPGCFTSSATRDEAMEDLQALIVRLRSHAPHWQDVR